VEPSSETDEELPLRASILDLQETGREGTVHELAERAGMNLDQAKRVMRATRFTVSLDSPIGEDSRVGDFIEDPSVEDPSDLPASELLQQRVTDCLQTLSEREREIISLRFGLEDGYTYTLEEIGRRFNVTRERIRQIEAKAIKKLQHPIRRKLLEAFIDLS